MTPEQLETNLELATGALLEEREYAKALALGQVKMAEALLAVVAERKQAAPVVNNATAARSPTYGIPSDRPNLEIINAVREIIGCPRNISVTDHAAELMRSLESLKAHRDRINVSAKAAGRRPGESVGELIRRLSNQIKTTTADDAGLDDAAALEWVTDLSKRQCFEHGRFSDGKTCGHCFPCEARALLEKGGSE